MGSHYERTVNEKSRPDGKKLYREEYFVSREPPLSSPFFQYHCYVESVWHPGYEFISNGVSVCTCHLIRHGRLKYSFNGRSEIAEPGDCVISKLSDGSICRGIGSEALCRTGIHFAKNPFAIMLLNAMFPEPRAIIRLKEPDRLSILFADLKETILSDIDDSDSVVHGLIFRILYEACRQRKDSAYPNELKRALQFISVRGMMKISRKEIADNCGTSLRTLTRLFHEHFGCAPARYIMKNRLERAKNMLSLHKISIKEIATICGFCSTAHFSRHFKREYGISPFSCRRKTE